MISALAIITASIAVGIWVALATFVGDTRGDAIGGTLAGLPSTAAFSLLFIGISQSPTFVVDATTNFPLTFSFTGSFLLFYSVLARTKRDSKINNKPTARFFASVFASLLIWVTLAFLALYLDFGNFTLSLLLATIVSVLLIYSSKGQVTPLQVRNETEAKWKLDIAWRVPLASIFVASAVIAGQTLGPITGGALAAFPAVSLATIFVGFVSGGHGEKLERSRALCRSMMVTSLLTVIPYSVAIRSLYPVVGLFSGTVIGYLVTVPFALLAYSINNNPKGTLLQ